MGRIKGKTGSITAVFILLISISFILSCENPVQSFIETTLLSPKFNMEVKNFAKSGAVNYGFSVDTYGDYIIVGAPAEHSNTTADESVYIYHNPVANKWEGPFKLPAPTGYTVGDRFGYSVSIYGDFAAVSAPDTSVGVKANAGAVYIYKRKEGTTNEWTEVKKLTKGDQTTYSVTGNEEFGNTVKLYDKWLLVGAPYDDLNDSYSNGGAVYRFKYNGSDWEYDYFFSRNTPLAGANFGMAIDVNSSYAVIGAPGEDIDINGDSQLEDNVGSVYIYSFNSDNFEFDKRITNSAGYTGDDDYFGGSLSVSGDYLAVGVAGAKVNNVFIAGKIQIYKHENGSWSDVPVTVKLDDPAEYDFFGFPVNVKQIDNSKYILMAGCADRDNSQGEADVGAVYIYTNTEGKNEWKLQKELRPSVQYNNSFAGSYFGRSIAVSNDYAVISACTLRNDTAFDKGRIYIFR